MSSKKRLIAATPTPFDDNDRIDFAYVEKHLQFLAERGVSGAVPSGTNGEAASMTLSEQVSLFEAAVKSKGNLEIVAGTGSTCLADTIQLTQSAERIGADAAMVIAPFFFKRPTLEGLVNYYSAVLSSTDLPIFLYNIPFFSAIEVSDELVERLVGFPNLTGIKDSGGDPERTRRYIAKFPRLRIFPGDDRAIEEMSGDGCAGFVTGTANAFPELVSRTIAECERGTGSQLQAKLTKLTHIFDGYPLFAVNKCCLHLRGFPMTHVRPPLVDLTIEQLAQLESDLKSEGYI